MHANTHYKNAYHERLLDKIESLNTSVFTRGDLTRSHSNQAQLRLNRALKKFIDQGHIIKVSHGVGVTSINNRKATSALLSA